MNLADLILQLRPDLCRRYGFDKPQNQQAYLAWLVTTGAMEYKALADDEGLRERLAQVDPGANHLNALQRLVWQARPDVQAACEHNPAHADFEGWYYTYGALEHRLWPWLSVPERVRVLTQPAPWPRLQHEAALALQPANAADLEPWGRPFGVNVIGYAYGQLGIGEDARMAARALQAAGVPMALVNFAPGDDIPQNDLSMAAHVCESGPYAFNLFCMTALEHARYMAEQGRSQIRGRFNIGYWPWELGQWPVSWRPMLDLVDEVWVSTQHTHDAVAPVCAANTPPIPVRVMPMAVDIGAVARLGSQRKARAHWGLPLHAQLFCFSFDLNSSIHRKNPQAVVKAFLQAFDSADWGPDQVGLVIKVHPPQRPHPAWSQLRAWAQCDPRLHIIESTLPRSELLALYKACDCFVSLHRAEGFGRGLAEALQLGLHVIATAYSGNMDFCTAHELAPLVHLVPARMVKVRPGQYPFGQGQVWASADIRGAAVLMRQQALAKRQKTQARHAVPRGGWPRFSLNEVGLRYRSRLLELWRQLQPNWLPAPIERTDALK